MKLRSNVLLVMALGTLIGIAVGPQTPIGQAMWPPKPLHTPPSGAQTVAFAFFGIVETVIFGLGVAFLAFGYPAVRRRAASTRMAIATYASIGWLLVSWLPHDNLHPFFGEDPAGLLFLIYAFHGTLILAGLVLARFVFDARSPQPVPTRTASAPTRPSSSSVARP